MDFDFDMPVRVRSGAGAVRRGAAEFSRLGGRCLLVTGGQSARVSGALADVRAALREGGVRFEVFDRIGPNPLLEDCHAAGAQARRMGADFLVGIGGGSPMDAAKAAAVYAAHPELSPAGLYDGTWQDGAAPLPLILVGATAGTGSEVSGVAVLTNGATGRKKSISDPACYARVAFADPGYTASMPLSVTVSTALDALSHAVEGFLNPALPDTARLFGERGLPLIWEGLRMLDQTHALPDAAGRERLYYGSLYAGMVLNACGTAFPHPMGYVLTEDYGFPHGRACTAFLPALVERGARYAPKRTDALLRLLQTDLAGFSGLVSRLTAAGEVRMTYEQAEQYARRWEGNRNFTKTPGGYTPADALALLKNLFVD